MNSIGLSTAKIDMKIVKKANGKWECKVLKLNLQRATKINDLTV